MSRKGSTDLQNKVVNIKEGAFRKFAIFSFTSSLLLAVIALVGVCTRMLAVSRSRDRKL